MATASKISRLQNVSLTFLGTGAGVPSKTRNVASLALKLDSDIWLFDVGEGTQHQLQKASNLKMGSISKIFISHTHGDHIFGLVPLLASMSNGIGTSLGESLTDRLNPAEKAIDIYGPAGLREYVNTSLRISYSCLGRPYRIHQLLYNDETPFEAPLSPNEMPGQIFRQCQQGYWRSLLSHDPNMQVEAGPILHSVRCIGYVFSEHPRLAKLDSTSIIPHLKRNAQALAEERGIKNPMTLMSTLQRELQEITLPDGTVLKPPELISDDVHKLAIMGDTYDATALIPLAKGASVVVHEATNALLPGSDEEAKGETLASITEKAKSRGHSVPQTAGHFAKEVGAKMLILNHFSNRYVDPEPAHPFASETTEISQHRLSRESAMKEIARQASEAWGGGEAITARDFLTVEIPRMKRSA